MVIAVLLCYPLTFSGFTVPANLFSLLFIVAQGVSVTIAQGTTFTRFSSFCQLPACIFLSSVLGRLTDVETVRCFLNACIICFQREIYKLPDASTTIKALLILSRLEVLRRIFAVFSQLYFHGVLITHNRHHQLIQFTYYPIEIYSLNWQTSQLIKYLYLYLDYIIKHFALFVKRFRKVF